MERISNERLEVFVKECNWTMLDKSGRIAAVDVAFDLQDARQQLTAMTAERDKYERALRMAAEEVAKHSCPYRADLVSVVTWCWDGCNEEECWIKYLLKQAEQAENMAEVSE